MGACSTPTSSATCSSSPWPWLAAASSCCCVRAFGALCPGRFWPWRSCWPSLFVIGRGFFPAIDPALVGYRTPAIDLLKGDSSLYRITTYVGGDEKTLNANTAMFYDIQDVRGYDSIIPRQYVDYMRLIQEQGELPYNRIAPIINKHPAAARLAAARPAQRQVCGHHPRRIPSTPRATPWSTTARCASIATTRRLPRAFLVPRAVVIPDADAAPARRCAPSTRARR